jgi:hypothetical protein
MRSDQGVIIGLHQVVKEAPSIPEHCMYFGRAQKLVEPKGDERAP